ncbi:MAG: pentapeptide repeat-containing protein [Cyanobacteria bacterium P01_G01_bin.38]
MTYCTNPECSHPKNPPTAKHCQACGSELLLRSRYRVIGALGRGGFGATFLARDESLPGRPPCVIKQLRPTAEASNVIEMARDLFQREAKILGKIGNHPQLPRLLDYFEAQQEFFLVQEYISGATLQQEVRRGGPFSEAGVKQFLSEILPVMQYIHSHQVIHRDIKPANLIRREQDKRLVLIDFGAVKDKVNSVKASQSDQTVLTAYAIGTPGYAPPEQMAMRPVYASDIYAIGVTCIYLLTAKSPKDLSYDPQTGEMLWQPQVKVSEHFSKVLLKMLEISVRLRYQSAEAILRDLDLEPYLDSLAQNMAFPSGPQSAPLTGPNGQGANSQDSGAIGYADFEESSASSGASPSSRMAAAIRARRDRASAKSTTSPHRYRRSFNLSSSEENLDRSNQPNQKSRQVTAEALRNAYSRGHRDFSLQVLNALDLQRIILTGASFASSKLKGVNLQNADLSNTNFGKADLTHASLRSVNLSGAYLGSANLEGSDLRGADLSRTCLKEANLRGANLCGAVLTDAIITDDQLAVARTNWSTVYPNGKRGLKG